MPAWPDDLESVLSRARMLQQEGLDDESETLLRGCLVRFPAHADVLLQLAANIMLKETDEPKYLVRRAVDAAPSDPIVLTRAVSLMLGLKEFEEARDYVRRAGASAPEDFVFAVDLINVSGQFAWEKGDDRLAEQLLSTAFDADPGGIGHGSTLAAFHADQGRLVEALKVLSVAMRHLPDDVGLVDLRDQVLEDIRGTEPR